MLQRKPVIVVLIWLSSNIAHLTALDIDVEKLSNVIATSHSCRADSITGMAVSIVKDGRTLLSRGYGVTTQNGNTPVVSSTRFNVASLTKAVTAALLVKVMAESGKYNLSTPIREILGQAFRFADGLRTEHATVEDLLSHKMAIPAHNRLRFDNTFNRKTIVDRLQHLKSYDTFRTTYIYSNVMYGLASRITEIIGGARWEDLVQRHLFQPLSMERSTFMTDANLSEANMAKPFELYFGKLEPISWELPRRYSELVGSGAFVTTADDMTKWMNFHLYEGSIGKGVKVMEEESVRELHKPRMALPGSSMRLFQQPAVPVATSFDIYALGWWRGYYRGYSILGHSGSTYGYRSFVVLVPALKAGVFVCMNGPDEEYLLRGALVNYILDHLMEVKPWLNATTICTFPAPWHEVSTQNPAAIPYDLSRPLVRNISAYVGTYFSLAYGRLEIRPRDVEHSRNGGGGQPRLMLIYGYGTWDLIPMPPKSAALGAHTNPKQFPEYFYAKGRGITAAADFFPVIFQPPSQASTVIQEITASGLESRLPPVFRRYVPRPSRGVNVVTTYVAVLITSLIAYIAKDCVLSLCL